MRSLTSALSKYGNTQVRVRVMINELLPIDRLSPGNITFLMFSPNFRKANSIDSIVKEKQTTKEEREDFLKQQKFTKA